MIFVTVGTELPFDRLVREVDAWAGEHARTDVFAQIGRTSWRPRFIQFSEFLDPPEFNRRFASASTIVAHAGMGTILSALRFEKPILVMPRRLSLGEHRNDHQLATVKSLLELGKINVALDERELRLQLSHLDQLQARDRTGPYASASLLSAVREFVRNGHVSESLMHQRPAPSAPTPAGPLSA